VVGPLFGFFAGWLVDRFGPRRLMMAGILMAGVALIGLGSISSLGMFYFFYFFNALGYVLWRAPAESSPIDAMVSEVAREGDGDCVPGYRIGRRKRFPGSRISWWRISAGRPRYGHWGFSLLLLHFHWHFF